MSGIIEGAIIGLVSVVFYNYLTAKNIKKGTAFFYVIIGAAVSGAIMAVALNALGINHG